MINYSVMTLFVAFQVEGTIFKNYLDEKRVMGLVG